MPGSLQQSHQFSEAMPQGLFPNKKDKEAKIETAGGAGSTRICKKKDLVCWVLPSLKPLKIKKWRKHESAQIIRF
jgi:hypothetical protein